MGKSEIEKLRPNHLNLRLGGNGTKSWNFAVDQSQKMTMDEKMETQLLLHGNMEVYGHQVAGHMNDGVHIGLMKLNKKVLKPLTKPTCGEREVQFYEELSRTEDPTLLEMKKFVPKFYGTETITVGDKQVKCIVLDDLTRDIKEPCVMDIKIGRRTYDPHASYSKIINEDQKYHETKRDLGFCIPGFQVYKISNGRICKYGKDYGKQLNKDTVSEALKIFLNADSGLNRNLLLQFLASLWTIQNWARKQRKIRLYSSSLLLIYDARRLRMSMQNNKKQIIEQQPAVPPPSNPKIFRRTQSLYRPMSLAALNNTEQNTKAGFSGQLTKDGPILHRPSVPLRIKPPPSVSERKSLPSLKRMHSFQNNFDNDLQNLKRDYAFILDELVNERRNQVWANVKMIDFAHVFPAEHKEADSNFLEGIENLVTIFEKFLTDTDWSYESNHDS